MHILLLELELHIHGAQSLKDKRSVLKGLIDRLRTRYNVAVAEVDHQDKWQRAAIAVVTVCSLRDRAQQTAERVINEIESRGTADLVGIEQQWL